MHAASVHPEPGSNSLKNGIYQMAGFRSTTQNINSRALIFVSSFYLNLPFVRVQKNCRDFLQVSFVSVSPILISVPHCTFLSISCCSIFKDHSYQVFLLILSLTRDLYIISYLEAFVKRFFKSFLFFSNSLAFRLGRFWLTLILYHIFNRLSRGFQKFFRAFFNLPLGVSASLTAYIVYHISFALSRVYSIFFQF